MRELFFKCIGAILVLYTGAAMGWRKGNAAMRRVQVLADICAFLGAVRDDLHFRCGRTEEILAAAQQNTRLSALPLYFSDLASGCGLQTELDNALCRTEREIAGVTLAKPFPTFPNGFPQDFIEKFEQAVGRGTLGNKPASGTAILDELGEEHLKTGKLIVYTSADSVFQIAANEAIVPLEELYRDCRIAREMLTGELEVGRVIARPFVGDHAGAFKRTGARRDFSAQPPTTMCDILAENGKTVYGVGKIEDIFDHRGITKSNHAAGNPACMQATFEAMHEDFDGLLFVNLVDFDMVYGHRRDVKGYAAALEAFDAQLPQIQAKMGEDDLLIITADHGCDPCHSGTDHTREHTPLLVWSKKMQGGANLGVRATYADISATVLDYFGLANPLHGVSFLKELK